MSAESSDNTGINFGQNNKFRDVNLSGATVAGRDIHQETHVTSGGDADRQQLLKAIEQLQAQVRQLIEAPAGDREDAHDELRKAREAAEQGDNDRLVKKLNAAQLILEGLGASLPDALTLGQTVAGLAQKAMGLG